MNEKKTKPAGGPKAYIAPPVQRAAKLIKYIANGDSVENMAQAAKVLKINRTTLLRLLHTFETEGFLERRSDGAGYQIGLELMSIVARSFFSQDIVHLSLPVLTRLAERTGLAAHLSVLEGTDVLYLLRRAPNTMLTSNVRVGTRLPAHATTMGRIILANMPETAVSELFGEKALSRFTDRTATSMEGLFSQLRSDKEQGIAWSEGNFEENVSSAAVAIFDFEGKPVGALNVSGSSSSLHGEKRKQEVATALKAAGVEVSRRLGWTQELPDAAPAVKRRSRDEN